MNSFKKPFFVIGPNVIESREHCFNMAKNIKEICDRFNIDFIFKSSFDKANRTSLESYRGVGIEEGIKILAEIKNKLKIKILTDIHEPWQAEKITEVADIIQIPAFLCRQTDLLKAVAQTGKIINIKKGQFCSTDVMHKSKEKILKFGNKNVILCERGTMFGYNDLIVDPRNLIWLKSNTNLVMMDITHCLQQPGIKDQNGIVKSGGLRELIPYMGKMALSLDIDGIFMEVHDNPELAKCDGPTQWPLDRLEWLLNFLLHPEVNEKCVVCKKPIKLINIIHRNIRGDNDNKCKVVQCMNCDHIQLIGYRENLKSHYDEDSQSNDIIKRFGINKKDIIDKERVEINRRIEKIKTIVELNNKKILDVIEPSENRVKNGLNINNISKNDLNIHVQYLDDSFAEKNKNKFDIVTLWHVLEHIDEHNIDKIILNMLKVCNKNGYIFIEIPNGDDELLCIERYRDIFYMIHHISYFKENTLKFLFNSLNIENYDISFVQRYDLENFLNWKHELGKKCDCNMYDIKNTTQKQEKWLQEKIKNKNTDAIFITIQK